MTEAGTWNPMSQQYEAPSLADFLLARIAEDANAARTAARGGSGEWGSWNRSWDDEPFRDLADMGHADHERIARVPMTIDEHVVRWQPARVLAGCEAKRRIVEMHSAEPYGDAPDEGYCEMCGPSRLLGRSLPWPCPTLRALALPYADHPDYRVEWRP